VGLQTDKYGGCTSGQRGTPPLIFSRRFLIFIFAVIFAFLASFNLSFGQPLRAKPDSVETPSWLQSVLTSLAYGPLHAYVRGIDPGQVLPLARLEYPRLILEEELSHPRLMEFSRVEGFRFRDPWRRFCQLILEEADRWVNGGLDSPDLLEKDRASFAKASAAANRITGDRRYLSAAEDAFRAIPALPEIVSFQGGIAGIGWGDDLEMGTALLYYAAAFDFTVDDLDPIVRAQAAGRFADACDRLVERMPLIPPDNHAVVISAGVASMALVLAGEDVSETRTPQEWLNAAMSLQSYAIAAQVLCDGTYREGPDYARYSVSALLPYYLYVNRIYRRDLARHPRLNALFDWMIFTSNPDGSVSPTDDAWTEVNLWEPLLMPLARNPEVIRWSYERRQHQFVQYQPNMVDALAFASFWPEARPPGGPPSRIFPDGGAAVFRESWDQDAFQVLLLGEPFSAFGGRHEQVDPGNLLIQQGSEPMLVDAGYGPLGTSDPDYEGYRDAGSHNMILMDGRGPERNPLLGGDPGASIMGAYDSPVVGGCRADMHYGQQPVARRILVPGHSYVLLEDMAPGNRDATMVSLFQAPGDVMPGEYGGYHWDNGNSSLSLIPLSSPLTAAVTAISQSYHSHQPEHRVLHQHIEMEWGDPEQALALLIPDDRVRITPWAVSGSPRSAGWIVEGESASGYAEGYFQPEIGGRFQDVILIGDGSEVDGGGITSDAARIWARRDASGDLIALSFRDATYFEASGFAIETSQRVSATFWRAGLRWSGYVEDNPDSVEMRFRGMGDPGIVRFREYGLPYDYQSDIITLVLGGDGPLEFGDGPPAIWVPERRLEEPSFLEEVAWSADPTFRLRMMSPRDRARLEGEILSDIRYGTISTLDPWMQDRWGVEGGGEALVDYMLGMADAMTSSTHAAEFRIPHRTTFSREVGDADVSLEGEGFWGDQNLRRLGGSLSLPDGDYVQYQEERPFRTIIRRSLDAGTAAGYQAGVRFEDGPIGDLWGGSFRGKTDDIRYLTDAQWGTGDLDDWRWGQVGVNGARWAANVVGGRSTDRQSMLIDIQQWLRATNLGYSYEYLDRGEYRGTIRASRRWRRITSGSSWEWAGGGIPSTYLIRNMTRWANGPWSVFSNAGAQLFDSLDVVMSGGFMGDPISLFGSVHGNSESATLVPDRLMRVAVDAIDWSTLEVEGKVLGETERSLETTVTCYPADVFSVHGWSNWDQQYRGPSQVGGGYFLHQAIGVGGDIWRQWQPYREDGMWASVATELLPPLSPAGYMEIRWGVGGGVREVRVRVESWYADIGPGIFYLEEPGVDRRFEGYFRMMF
jgi:hypothetical protein